MKTLNLFQQTATLGLIGSTILFTPLKSQALTVEEVVNPQATRDEWVTDMANILSDATETELNRLITNLERDNGTEIAVVTVPETAPADSPKAFATQLFNYWGIGKAETDNGILFLVSIGDRRVEIETGYGIEEILPDAEVKEIIDTQITPQYKQGNFDRGTMDGINALISPLNPITNIQDTSESTFNIVHQIKASSPIIKTSSFGFTLLVFLVVLVIFMAIANNDDNGGSGGNRSKRKNKKRNSYSGGSYGGYSGGSSGSGSSGGGFGGGSSGGGGAGGGF